MKFLFSHRTLFVGPWVNQLDICIQVGVVFEVELFFCLQLVVTEFGYK